MRGLYFCGGGGGDPGTTEVVFVGDLLHQKVFPEAALAQPTGSARGRARVWRAGLAALILGGVLWGLFGLDWGVKRLRPAAATAPTLLAEIEDNLPGADMALSAMEEPAREILAAAGRVESFRVRSIALPASWPSRLQGGVGRSVSAGLERIVFPAFRADLEQRAKLLAELPRSRTPPPRNGDVIRITSYPEFQDLEEFSKELEKLDRLVAVYQRFSSAGSGVRIGAIDDFNRLAAAILGDKLRPAGPGPWPAAFWARRLAALRVAPFDFKSTELGGLLRAEASERAERFFTAVFERNPLAWDLDQIMVAWIDGGPLRRPRPAEVESYRRLRASLDRTRSHLELPEVQWTAADRADLGERFDAILRRFHDSPFLGPASDDEIKGRTVEEFRHLQKSLETYEIDDTDPLLVREDARWRLSPRIEEILASLDRIFEAPFMQRHCEALAIAEQAPEGLQLLWKAEPLESALALVAAYESWDGDLAEFLKAQGLEELPRPLRGTEPQVTAQAIGENVVCLIAEAQTFESPPPTDDPTRIEAGIKLQVQSLRAVEKTLEDLLAALGRLELRGRQAKLAGILRDQRIGLLAQLDELLERQRLYTPAGGDFSWWKGGPAPALEAFGAASADELGDYLKTARGIAQRLSSEYAQPLLAMFGESGQLDLLRPVLAAANWRRIGSDLAAYEDKQAGNPVSRLEDFVVAIAGEEEPDYFDLYTCFSALSPAGAGAPQGDDFFLRRQAELRVLLLGRCRQLADRIGFEKYRVLAGIHDAKLWNRFPFASPEVSVDAPPEAVRAFFEADFRRALLLIRNLPEESVWFGERKDDVRAFMERMERVRLFFSSYLSPETEAPPLFDLQVRFRIERTREQGANQIIEWLFDLGEDPEKGPIDLLSTRSVSGAPEAPASNEPDGRWIFGRPVTLTFRWAKDSPFAPYAPAEARPPERWTIRDRALVIRYREPWSLLRLLAEYRAPAVEFADLSDPEPETVKLSIVTVSADRPEPRACADVYLRISLLSPEEEPTRLEVPDFPRERAPVVDRPVALPETETPRPAEVIGSRR